MISQITVDGMHAAKALERHFASSQTPSPPEVEDYGLDPCVEADVGDVSLAAVSANSVLIFQEPPSLSQTPTRSIASHVAAIKACRVYTFRSSWAGKFTLPSLNIREVGRHLSPIAIVETQRQGEVGVHALDAHSTEISPLTMAAAKQAFADLPTEFGPPDMASSDEGTLGFEWISCTKDVKKLFIDIGPGTSWRIYARLVDGRHKTTSLPTVPLMAGSYIRAFLDELMNDRGAA